MSAGQLAALSTTVFLGGCAAAGRLAFLRSEFAQPWRRSVAATLLLIVLTAVVFYPVIGHRSTSTFDADAPWFPAIFLGHLLLVLFLAAWGALRWQADRVPIEFRVDQLGADLRLGVVVGVGGWMLTIAVTLVVAVIASRFGAVPSAPEGIPPLMIWLAALPLSRKLLVIGAAMSVEEAFFRGFLQTRIGLALSSVLFTLAHASYGLPFMLVSVLTISLLIGNVYHRRGRLLPCIVAHGIFDAIQLLIVLPWAVRTIQATG